MAVRWSQDALDDREALLDAAGRLAAQRNTREILAIALAADTRIRNEAKQLDGAAAHVYDIKSGHHLYTTQDGRFVLAYHRARNKRGGITATISSVWPASGNWLTERLRRRASCRAARGIQSFRAPSSGSLAA